jgi:hypothetical protein
MPWQSKYVDPEVFLKHHGLTIYRTYKHDDIDQVARTYSFTLSTECGEGNCRCLSRSCRNLFDVRLLPNWTEPSHPPFLTGKDNTPENQQAWKRYQANRIEEKHIKRVIREAVDRGFSSAAVALSKGRDRREGRTDEIPRASLNKAGEGQ